MRTTARISDRWKKADRESHGQLVDADADAESDQSQPCEV